MLSIAIIIVMLFLCASVPAVTEENRDGWLSITIGDDRSDFDVQGIRMAIYLIATGDYGNWTMADAFNDIAVFTRSDGSASVNMTLGQIRRRIAERKIRPTAEAVSDEAGKCEFRELAHGIYFTEMTGGPERLTMSPMLLPVPNRNGSVQVRAVAKYVFETPTPSPTPSPRPTLTPFITPDISPTPTAPPDDTPTPTGTVTGRPSSTPTPTPVKVTREPVPTPAPVTDRTPVPIHVPTLTPNPGETTVSIVEYEAALGLGNIQIHVGVCFE